MKKVAHICTNAKSHRILVDKLALIQKKGYDLHLISSREGYDADLMSRHTMTLHFVPMKETVAPWNDMVAIARLVHLLRSERYDIVHTHNAKAGVIGRIAAWLAGVPLIVHTTHGLPFYEGQGRLKNTMYREMERIGAWFCDAIASQNREDMSKIKKYAPRKKILYEGNGVDLELLDNRRSKISAADIEQLRLQHHIGPHQKVILVGARFEPVKNHFFLLDGLKRLKDELQVDFACLLAGKGGLEQEVEARIKLLGLERYVQRIGYHTDIYPYIQMADTVVLTSEKEGIPRILMEAMSFEKAVLATDVLGTRELIRHNETGVLVPYKDVKLLAQQLGLLLNDDAQRARIGRMARASIELEFNEDIVTRRIHAYYRDLQSRTNRPQSTSVSV
ncbi:glycosyltransferase family 4 protein [Paenibacillus apiarius]|uniref:Glycosyltransferase family 4 protein n=1 Tax=Paenibacillus apiarius TaxID=46240 RepID=A0ABT4DUV7_9BACL|nr:glycosyltransferase family 4 protein [Paenibacillus apiarius]MBN3523444.1 glycosyltransferase family 4 protein [Paenibacillus apiarius]MCY9516416.1 glycosyltransferase family 4 protein [Paenibacillus apiarius]MCY9521124.1 glycosyltransferase family 4 protein [Paenibacillus apiarius]MCY9551971.1 glycosyltransferase family 4 protein [Paenibacillus apiarius]MCY9560916.1 glycosyltransferase family 4 protein [Paenibacillus apiarius]